MDKIDNTIDERSLHEERVDGAHSSDGEPTPESPGEAKEQLFSEVHVHASAEGERRSPDYMDTREEDEKSRSSSSSSDDEEVRVEEEVKAEDMAEERTEVEPEPEVQVKVEEVNGEAHDGSRRSSASSSASSASPGDPCDDPPIQPRILEEDNANDVMLMTNLNTDTTPMEDVEYSVKTLENVTLDESSAAPHDPNRPDIALFVKVRHLNRSAEHQAVFAGLSQASLTVQHEASTHILVMCIIFAKRLLKVIWCLLHIFSF